MEEYKSTEIFDKSLTRNKNGSQISDIAKRSS